MLDNRVDYAHFITRKLLVYLQNLIFEILIVKGFLVFFFLGFRRGSGVQIVEIAEIAAEIVAEIVDDVARSIVIVKVVFILQILLI